jgi:hypothetical protein
MGINKIKSQRRKSALSILLQIALRRWNFSCTSSLLLEILFHAGLQNICTNALKHGARFQHPAAPNAHASNQTQHQFSKRAAKEVIIFL